MNRRHELSPRTPPRFAEDWHPQLGAKLKVLPRDLCLAGEETLDADDEGTPRLPHFFTFWPDLGSLIGNEEAWELAYQRAGTPDDLWIRAAYQSRGPRWHFSLWRGLTLLCASEGGEYESAVSNAIEEFRQPIFARFMEQAHHIERSAAYTGGQQS